MAEQSLDSMMYPSEFEQELFEWLNKVRDDPECVVPALEGRKMRFKPDTKDMLTSANSYVATKEGPSAIDEAIEYLQTRVSDEIRCDLLTWSDEAFNVATKHTLKTVQTGDRALITENDRNELEELFALEFGNQEQLGGHAELHEYGSVNPLEVILSLIIDDGNKMRSNRKTLFGHYDYFACSSKPHAKYARMTSFVFIVAKESIQKEMSEAIKAAQAELGIEETGPHKKYNWIKKKSKVAIDSEGIINVTVELELADGEVVELHYNQLSKY